MPMRAPANRLVSHSRHWLKRRILGEPIQNEKLFKRISEIYGIPVDELRPVREYWTPFTTHAEYSFRRHSYTVEEGRPFREHTLSHEERHGVQFLLFPKKVYQQNKSLMARRRRASFFEMTDTTSPIVDTFFHPHLMKFFFVMTGSMVASTLIGLGAAAIPIGFYVKDAISVHQIQKLIRTHGEDGLVLLYANPPFLPKGQISFKFGAWRKSMIKQGYLQPVGGLTKEGEEYVRKKISKEAVQRRLDRSKKRRIQDRR